MCYSLSIFDGKVVNPPPPPTSTTLFSARSASHFSNLTRVLVDKFLHVCDPYCTDYIVYCAKIILCKGEVTLMVLATRFLSTLGFSKPFLRWLNSYLSDRWHFVEIDDRTSELVNVRFSMPQGSILGPMLFNLYVSDLQDHLPSSIGSFHIR